MGNMSLLRVDKRYRILLDKRTREVMGLEEGDALLAIPFKGGVTLTVLKGKHFIGCLNGFNYDEEAHEASRYLFQQRKTSCQS